jgi:hypothetical protein
MSIHQAVFRKTNLSFLLVALLTSPLQANDIRVPKGPGGGAGEATEFAPKPKAQRIPPRENETAPTPDSATLAPLTHVHDMPTLMAGAWRTLEGEEYQALYRKLSQDWPKLFPDFLPDVREFRILPTPFYDKTSLLEIRARGASGELVQMHILLGPKENVILDGMSPTIHELNEQGGLRLETVEQASAYLRFFCSAINSNYGPFHIIQDANELWLLPDADKSMRDRAAAHIVPLTMKPNPDGGWDAEATLAYANALFTAKFHIQPGGVVEMMEDRTVMADLPLRRLGYQGHIRVEVCEGRPCPRLAQRDVSQ